MAATIAWATCNGCQPVEAVRLGVAAAVENVGGLLRWQPDPQIIRQRAEQVRVEAIG
jgi:hypothetical protein